MLHSKLPVTALIFASAMVAAIPARANCAMPISYNADVTGNTVVVAPSTGDGNCPQPGGMLRQDPASGEIVKLADFCTTTANGDPAYADECVPEGTYRYGFAEPYACNSSACSVDYFTEVKVTTPLDANCMRSADNAGPTAANAVPWKDDATICTYQGGGGSATGGSGGATGGSGGATGGSGGSTATGGSSVKGSSGGCSVGVLNGAAPVFGANIVALVVGIALMRRRKGRGA
ncbi:MAG: hypothetical protein U0441_11390 [Polyangiaceae bacterium]